MDFIYLLAAIAIGPKIVYRMLRQNRYRTGWAQRFGKITRKDPALKKCIWLHAVSVGEVNATRTIVRELENRFGNYQIIITTTTDTGFARATALYGGTHKVFYFPLDFYGVMRRAFRGIQPAICLLMELEVWPNFVQIADRLNIPVVVVNGRLSDESFSRYRKIRPIVTTIFRRLSLVLAQTEEYAERFRYLGCPEKKVLVTGSLKYDTAQIIDKVEGAGELAKQLNIGRERLWVAGATGNDEEKILLEVFKKLKEDKDLKDLRLVIVPRKPERFDEVSQLTEQHGFSLIRYSTVKESAAKSERRAARHKPQVILGDTMGDLRKFYSLATVIFVGRSLVPMGGSDMAEAAALGKCTIFGPHAFNFRHTVDVLEAGDGAIIVADAQDLFEAMQKCLSDPAFAEQIARNGREVIRQNQGATERSLKAISALIKRHESRPYYAR
jgi:3-deoxy-D-manno-octulosonic-acid transferase